ncbi:MAG: hypothetical protein JO189_25435 [Deltaproteobacteria bacterium]|nr:hypothetical protein [Deltaproteobacteria bacterium]
MKRYVPLLLALFGVLILQPIVFSLSSANVSLNVFIYVVLPTVIYAAGPGKSLIAITAALALAIVVTRLAYGSSLSVKLLILSHGLSFVLMVFVAGVIGHRVFRAREITADIVVGAVCMYLVVGMSWSFFYYFLQIVAPGSMMAIPIVSRGSLAPAPLEQYRFWEMAYFSMSALSTMGFLSTEPLTPLARQLAVVEAIMGQMYVAVLIARIVALSTAQAMKDPMAE